MDASPFLPLHIAVGSVALATFWLAIAASKGGRWHRAAGRVFFVAMLLVVATVAPLLATADGFDPPRVVQLAYLSACVGAVVTIGWASVRWRRAPERFGRLPLRATGTVLLGLGAAVLVAGVATRDPVAAVLSWVGLVFGAAMRRYAHLPSLPPQGWWLRWHLDAVCVLLTAVHGTLSFVAWRAWIAPTAGPAAAALAHLGALVVAVVARGWLSWRYRAPSWVFPPPRRRSSGARQTADPVP